MMHYHIFLPDEERTPVEISETGDGICVTMGREKQVISLDELDGLKLNGGMLNYTQYKFSGGYHFTWNGKACVAENKGMDRTDAIEKLRISMLVTGVITILTMIVYTFLLFPAAAIVWPSWLFACAAPIARTIFYFVSAAKLKEGEVNMARVTIYIFFVFAGINFLGLLLFRGVFSDNHFYESLRFLYLFPLIFFRGALVIWFGYGLRKLDARR